MQNTSSNSSKSFPCKTFERTLTDVVIRAAFKLGFCRVVSCSPKGASLCVHCDKTALFIAHVFNATLKVSRIKVLSTDVAIDESVKNH